MSDDKKPVPVVLSLSDLGSAGAAIADRIIENVVAERDAALARADAAEARVAELEAREQGWRPVTEPPDESTRGLEVIAHFTDVVYYTFFDGSWWDNEHDRWIVGVSQWRRRLPTPEAGE